jgi:hypothetical protein
VVRTLTALLIATLMFVGPAQAGLSKREFNKARKQLKLAQMNKNGEELVKAIARLGEDDSKRAAKLILKVTATNVVAKAAVFDAAGEALSSMSSKGAVEALVSVVSKRGGHDLVKILAIESLTARKDASSGKALGAALSDPRPGVLRATLRAVRTRKPGEATPALIDLLEKLAKRPNALIQSQIEHALVEITGKWFDKVEDWRQFWKHNSHKGTRPVTGSVKAALKTSERGKTPPPKFFGTEIRSERVVFAIDVSGSMKGERLAKCKKQLTQCISSLSVRSSFTVVVYSNQIRPWKKDLQRATPKNKASAASFVETLRASGNTCTRKALLRSLETTGADTIVLLSDGMPTGTKPDGAVYGEDEVINDVTAENKRHQWEIHTFGFGDKGGTLADFMETLAKKNHGKFTRIK